MKFIGSFLVPWQPKIELNKSFQTSGLANSDRQFTKIVIQKYIQM